MYSFLFIFFYILVVTSSNLRDSGYPKVNLEIYYESMCYGSQDFIVNYLSDIYTDSEISLIVNITLIPYGNAVTLQRSPPVFECQNGESECRGNYIASCAIHLYPNNYLSFITCIEETLRYTTSDVARCARLSGISGSAINECADSDDALYYHLHYGDITPKHDWVPWIVVNNECIGEAISRTKEIICNTYTGPRPSSCPSPPEPPKVEVRLYYETYVSACKDYLFDYIQQLFNNAELMSISTFKFIAYGKAVTRSSDPIDIVCYYGQNECQFNIMHMCIAKYLYTHLFSMLNCIEGHYPSEERLRNCAILYNLPYEDTVHCYTSNEGLELLYDAGLDTPSFISFPFVTVAKSTITDIYNLRNYICASYTGTKPDVCYSSSLRLNT